MTQVLFPKEKLLLETVIINQPENGNLLKAAIDKIFIHLPIRLIHERYDRGLVQEFLRELIKDSSKRGLEQYFQSVAKDETIHALKQKCLVNGPLQENILKSLGSWGLTKLIRDTLARMAKQSFKKEDIVNLTHLIESRNTLRQAEERFLEDAFRRYLQKQISLYS